MQRDLAGPPGWTARYPDLAGKTVVLAGTGGVVVDAIAGVLLAGGCRLAVLAGDRATVQAVEERAGRTGGEVYAVIGDPCSDQVWQRVVPHVEQRLGPVDVVVAVGLTDAAGLRACVVPDMVARGRGVVVAVAGEPKELAECRHRRVTGGGPAAIAAAVQLASSDLLDARVATIQLAG